MDPKFKRAFSDATDNFRWLSLNEPAVLLPFAGQRVTLEHTKKSSLTDNRPRCCAA